MTAERTARVLALVARQARGAPVSIAHVCAAAVSQLGVDGAGLTVMAAPAVRQTLHSTDQVAGELEEWQLTFGEGPCVDAFSDGGPVLAVDLRSPHWLARWPAFTPAAVDSGAQAVFALPMQIGAIRFGVLDLYRTVPASVDVADALAFADAACALLLAQVEAKVTNVEAAELDWLRDDPTANHHQVHQATGMIIVQLGVGAEAAFARLRAFAYAQNRRLGDVARDVVERRLRFDPE